MNLGQPGLSLAFLSSCERDIAVYLISSSPPFVSHPHCRHGLGNRSKPTQVREDLIPSPSVPPALARAWVAVRGQTGPHARPGLL